MKKKIKIGIPRALLYYRHNVLWKNFFENLNCNILLSPETNKEIINYGTKLSIDESCFSFKVYLGHVNFLAEKCDYLLIPRIVDYGKGEKVCVKFNGLYDIVKSLFPNVKLLDYNIEHTKRNYEFFQFLGMGIKLKKGIFKTIFSYVKSKRKEKKHNETLINNQINKLKTNKPKILLVSHPYNLYDNYIGKTIVKMLESSDIELLYSDRINKKESKLYSKELTNTLYWTYSKEIIGAIKYYEWAISGIVFITAFPCGVDSLVNELLMRKTTNVPKINLLIDENTTDVGLQTRIESFLDIIKEKQKDE